MSERLSDERLREIAFEAEEALDVSMGAIMPLSAREVAYLCGELADARAVVEAARKYRNTAMLAPLWDALDTYDERMKAGAGADGSATRKDAGLAPSGPVLISTPSPAPAACAPPAATPDFETVCDGPQGLPPSRTAFPRPLNQLVQAAMALAPSSGVAGLDPP